MCIVLRALHTINTNFSGKHASRTCRFNHSSCISKNRPFSETKRFRRISFCQSQFRNDIKYFVTDKRRRYARIEHDFLRIYPFLRIFHPFKLKRDHMMDMS